MNNVLIIEDDKEICVMIKDHLEKYNYQVFFTLTGANAIERIKELSPDLIILDLMLPFISGDNDVINTHISNLRKKLKGEGCRIKTIWGLGYRFAK